MFTFEGLFSGLVATIGVCMFCMLMISFVKIFGRSFLINLLFFAPVFLIAAWVFSQ
jgi:hypothetical protein